MLKKYFVSSRNMTTLSERIGEHGCRKAVSQARALGVPEGHLFDGALTLICRLQLLLTWVTTMIFVGSQTSGPDATVYPSIYCEALQREKSKIQLERLLLNTRRQREPKERNSQIKEIRFNRGWKTNILDWAIDLRFFSFFWQSFLFSNHFSECVHVRTASKHRRTRRGRRGKVEEVGRKATKDVPL